MKIAQIICTFPPYQGGMGNSAFEIAKTLKKNQYEVTTWTTLLKKEDDINYSSIGELRRLKTFWRRGNGALLLSLFKELKKFDIVYLHYPFFGTAEIVWLFKIFNPKKKLIVHYHMDTPNLKGINKILSLPSKLILKSLLKKAKIIICSSFDYIENSQIAEIYKANPKKFREIPFAVDLNRFKPAPKNNQIKKILFVGGLDQAHHFKGIDILLESLYKIKEKQWELLIVGDGNLKKQYEEKAEKLKIAKKVNFLGKVSNEDLPKIYQKCNFFVLPSTAKNEAFGIVLLEAMASGLAIIASDLPGVRCVFTKNEGLLVKPKSINDLTKKITYLLENEEILKKMSLSGRKLAEKKYNTTRIDKLIINCFKNENLLNQ